MFEFQLQVTLKSRYSDLEIMKQKVGASGKIHLHDPSSNLANLDNDKFLIQIVSSRSSCSHCNERNVNLEGLFVVDKHVFGPRLGTIPQF
jgi:hypothetical protein